MENDTLLPGGLHLSIRQISEETGRARETVAKRLGIAKIEPSGVVKGNPVYRLRDALPVLYTSTSDGSLDPDKLEPHARHAHYKAEREKLGLAADAGEYIPREDFREEMARVAKLLAQALDAIPDLIERDCAADPRMVQLVQTELDKLRERIAESLAEELPDAGIRECESGDARGGGDHPPAAPDAPERGGVDIFAM